jgi:hypothetical protein
MVLEVSKEFIIKKFTCLILNYAQVNFLIMNSFDTSKTIRMSIKDYQ